MGLRTRDIMINSEEFGMTFWFNDEKDLCYAPTFTSGEPDFGNIGYVEEWDDWSDVNNAELIRIIQRLVA